MPCKMNDVNTRNISLIIARWEFLIRALDDVSYNVVIKLKNHMKSARKYDDIEKFNLFISYNNDISSSFFKACNYKLSDNGNVHKLEFRDCVGTIDWESKKSSVEISNEGVVSIDSFLRYVTSFLSLVQGGALVHSAGIIKNNRCFIFPGPSMSGKSTIAGLFRQRFTVIGEELSIILPSKEGYSVYGTPFLGSSSVLSNYGGYRLGGIIFHEKSDGYNIRKIEEVEALIRFVENVTFYSSSKKYANLVLENSEKITRSVKAFVMDFPNNSEWLSEFDKYLDEMI